MNSYYLTNLREPEKTDPHPWGSCAQNTGNLLFYRAIKKTTGLPIISWEDFLIKYKKQEFDSIVISDLVWIEENKDKELLYSVFNDIKKRTRLIPLSVGLASNGGRDFVFSYGMIQFLKELSEYITIPCRGLYTQQQLSLIGVDNTVVLGCPSLFFHENPDFIVRSKSLVESPKIVTHATIYPNNMVSVDDLRYLICLSMKKKYTHIEQTFFEWIYIIKTETDDLNILNEWKWNHKYFFNFNQWFAFMLDQDFTIGSRFHCSVMSILAGTPALVLQNDYRVKEMCEYFKIPMITFEEFRSNSNIRDLYRRANYEKFNENYKEKYARYMDYLKSNKILFK